MSTGPTGEITKGLIAGVIDSVKQRPFTELSALITMLTIIGLGYYELTTGRPELIRQINQGHQEAHQLFNANLDRVLQAEDKRTELFKEMLEEQRNVFGGGGNAEVNKPIEKTGAGT